jgi:hypothetical protein
MSDDKEGGGIGTIIIVLLLLLVLSVGGYLLYVYIKAKNAAEKKPETPPSQLNPGGESPPPFVSEIGGVIGGDCSVSFGEPCIGKLYAPDKAVAEGDTCANKGELNRVYMCTEKDGWTWPACDVGWGDGCVSGTLGMNQITPGVKCRNTRDGGNMYECANGKWGLARGVASARKGDDGKYAKTLCDVVYGRKCIDEKSLDGKTIIKDGDVCNNVNDQETLYKCTANGWDKYQYNAARGSGCIEKMGRMVFGAKCNGTVDLNQTPFVTGDICQNSVGAPLECKSNGTWGIPGINITTS